VRGGGGWGVRHILPLARAPDATRYMIAPGSLKRGYYPSAFMPAKVFARRPEFLQDRAVYFLEEALEEEND